VGRRRQGRTNERTRRVEGRTISIQLAARLSGYSTFTMQTTKDAAQLNGPSYGIYSTVQCSSHQRKQYIQHCTLHPERHNTLVIHPFKDSSLGRSGSPKKAKELHTLGLFFSLRVLYIVKFGADRRAERGGNRALIGRKTVFCFCDSILDLGRSLLSVPLYCTIVITRLEMSCHGGRWTDR